jgi:hypothetical protein
MKHEIEMPDLPEGWEAVAYRIPKAGEYYLGSRGIKLAHIDFENLWLIVRKKQTRRIVLEEVEAGFGKVEFFHDRRCWKIVEDNKCAE